MNIKRSFLQEPVKAVITNKYLLFDDVVVYSVALNKIENKNFVFLLKPKSRAGKRSEGEFPIEGLYRTKEGSIDISCIDFKELQFIEWVYLKV